MPRFKLKSAILPLVGVATSRRCGGAWPIEEITKARSAAAAELDRAAEDSRKANRGLAAIYEPQVQGWSSP
jgi:hypothetical protein